MLDTILVEHVSTHAMTEWQASTKRFLKMETCINITHHVPAQFVHKLQVLNNFLLEVTTCPSVHLSLEPNSDKIASGIEQSKDDLEKH